MPRATSTAPDAASTAAAGAVQSLGQLRLKPAAGNVVAPIAKIVVSSIIRGALRNELETPRQITIRTELTIQEKLIEEVAGIVRHDIGEMRQKLENRGEAFEDLIAGKLTLDRVNSLLTDFSAILSVGETLNKDLGGK